MTITPAFGKFFIVLGGIGGPTVFFSTNYLTRGGGHLDREIEVTNSVLGTNWQQGYVTPVFDSQWLSNAFDKTTKYSYGYVARANGTDYFDGEETGKRIKRSAKGAEGELRLVERVGDTQSAGLPDGNSRNGLTPKKFFLVGVNANTKDVEMTGLVSLVKTKHPGIQSKCQKNEAQIQNGYCDDKVFFKKYEKRDDQPGFIETQLKNKGDKQVAVLEIKNGVVLAAIFGNGTKRGKNSVTWRNWSRSAPLQVTVSGGKKQNLFVGPTLKNGQKYNRPYVVLHDLKFAEGVLRGKWQGVENGMANLIQIGIVDQKNGLTISKIPLNSQRQYYLWDPSFTEIKDGQLRTKNGHALPWNNNVELLYTYQLIK